MVIELDLSPIIYELPIRERLADVMINQDKIEDAIHCLELGIKKLNDPSSDLSIELQNRIIQLE